MAKSDVTDVQVRLVHQTENAYLVRNADDLEVWVPKSRCELFKNAPPALSTYTLTLSEALATEKGLV